MLKYKVIFRDIEHNVDIPRTIMAKDPDDACGKVIAKLLKSEGITMERFENIYYLESIRAEL